MLWKRFTTLFKNYSDFRYDNVSIFIMVNYISHIGQHNTYANCLIIYKLTMSMELQCGCAIDEIGGILLVECKGHKKANFRE